jgi:hypothetical protein
LHFSPEISAVNEIPNGVTCNIMSRYYEFKTEKETAQTARTLIQLLGSEEFGCKKVLYKDANSQQGCKFSASTDLKYTLNKVLANREWTYEKVLERTRDTFTVPINEKEAPSFKLGTEKITNIFQVNISLQSSELFYNRTNFAYI